MTINAFQLAQFPTLTDPGYLERFSDSGRTKSRLIGSYCGNTSDGLAKKGIISKMRSGPGAGLSGRPLADTRPHSRAASPAVSSITSIVMLPGMAFIVLPVPVPPAVPLPPPDSTRGARR